MQEEQFDEEDEKVFLASTSLSAKHTLRSEMAQEIISRQPGFLEKWSLLVFLAILVLIFSGTWFVHYPDVVTTRAIILAENAPKEIIVRQEGQLTKLIIKNGQPVKRNDVIGRIENTELRAPIDGKLSFNIPVHENSYLKAGTLLAYVIPENANYYAQIVLPQNNFAKMDTGLRVQLRLDAYPYEEWGFLDGTIAYIAGVPSDAGFLATIRLNNSLMTNDKKKLSVKNGLKAQAMIVTKDMRLLQRFYYGFVKSTSIDK
ncbi:HlyD family efflux transporter periplasmic adaptor subunit [Mucilaginibacter sp. UYCu711]|uniref:HlyD family efflux transporter periplasmic adaptor subunit n=1 Tax=Mucilaginibacter sp. UYCu711 TaxID=3156339 RepID=UPI003D24C8F1